MKIAASAAQAGKSVKLVMECGAWPADRLRGSESLAALQHSIDLGVISSTPPGPRRWPQRRASWQNASRQFLKKLYVATKIPPKKRRWPLLGIFRRRLLSACLRFEYVDKSLKTSGLESLDLIQYHT